MKEEILPHLDKLSIYQLRTIGRRIGVHLPTTLKKKDLIQKITAIACGEEKPCVKTSNRGRPAKLIGAMSFKKEDETYGSIFGDLEEYYKLSTPDLASCEAIKLKEIPNVEEIIMTGYVEISSDGYAYFLTSPQLSSEPVYVKVSTVAKYNLKRGDIIEAKILKDPNTKCSIVEDIIRVNDYNPQKMPITYDFSNQQKMSKNKFIFPVMQNSLSEVENIGGVPLGIQLVETHQIQADGSQPLG